MIKQQEDEIRKAYAQTELILSSITSILIGVSQRGLVTHWNSIAENTFGIPAASVIDHPFSECGIQWDIATILEGIRRCRAQSSSIRLDDIPFRRPNGQEGFLGFTIIPVKQDTEGHIECILFGADVTERKQIDELKDEFVSTVSHELRTPLTIIREGVSQIFEGVAGKTNEEQRRLLFIALEGIDRLGRIIEDLLDISRIEAGRVQLKRGRVDLVALAREASSVFYTQAQERGLEIKEKVSKKKVEIYIDKDKIFQVFTNLIANALKFTEKGSIGISVIDKEDTVECEVSDTGKGISQEDLTKVFGKFQQFGREAGPGKKGTGLGLSISKGFIELHGGRIWVTSELDRGTQFTFTLPKYTARIYPRHSRDTSCDKERGHFDGGREGFVK